MTAFTFWDLYCIYRRTHSIGRSLILAWHYRRFEPDHSLSSEVRRLQDEAAHQAEVEYWRAWTERCR